MPATPGRLAGSTLEGITMQATCTTKQNPNGVILYEGPSVIDGAPIVVIATGLETPSANEKTGAMVQTFILRADVSPVDALATGADASVCGDCGHRPILAAATDEAPCYVNVARSVLAIWQAYRRGSYRRITAADIPAVFGGRRVRLGAYGDPYAAPVELWRAVVAVADGHTGYTHQWQNPGFDPDVWAPLVMASADTIDEAALANLHGMRVFRVSIGVDVAPGEISCPASDEGGRRVQCFDCRLCAGTSKAARDIVIADHSRGHAARARRVIPLQVAA